MRKIFVVISAFLLIDGTISCGGKNETSPEAIAEAVSRPLDKGTITLRVFEGSMESAAQPAKQVTSSFLQHHLTATVASDVDPDAQSRRIREAFNLNSVVLLTEFPLVWEKGKSDPGFQIFRIENKTYQALVALKDPASRTFKIDVVERNKGAQTNLLSTEAGLPRNLSTVFGFKNVQGKPYFISLQIGEWAPTVGGVAEGVIEGRRGEEPVAATGDVHPPKIIKRVDPVYPEEARKAGIEGIVICEATINPEGRMESVKVLRSVPGLDQAAVNAVKQWIYEPMMIEGKPSGVVFTVTVRFKLKDKAAGKIEPSKSAAGGVMGGTIGPGEAPVRALDGIAPPTLIKRVDPVYPPEARQAGIEGIVILEATTDPEGRIVSVKVLRSIPELERAAVDAVKQWIYEPMMIDGKPRGVVFTVTVRFMLKD